MNYLKCLILSAILLLTAVDARAQVLRLDNPDQFGEGSLLLTFGGLGPVVRPGGANVGTVFDRWGVRFRAFGGNDLEQVSFTVVPPTLGPPALIPGIRHVPSSAEADGPLSIDLGRAAFRVALLTHTIRSDVTLRAFTPDGEPLGSVQPEVTGDATFFGVETSDPRGIGLIVLANPADDPIETLSSLRVEYLEPVSGFTVVVPQVGFGAIGDAVLDTRLDLVNLTNQDAEATIFLLRSDGSPMSTPQGPGGEIPLSLNGFEAASLVLSAGTTLDSEVRVGYARIESSQPLEATALYTTRDRAGVLLGEAGIGSAIEQFYVGGFGEKLVVEDLNTGLAVVNTAAQAVEVRVAVESERGPSGTFTLEPGAHRALFLDELIAELQGRDFSGTVFVRGNGPVAVALLRTRAGVAAASVPTGGLLQQEIR